MILAIHSFPGANEAVARHYPYWTQAGFEKIIGIGTTDGGCQWPPGTKWINIGRNTYIDGDALPRRLVETIEYLITNHAWEHAAIIEYDTVTFKPLPVPLTYGLHMVLAGGPQGGRKGKFFYHNPWVANRKTWEDVLVCGRQMLEQGDFENGSPDCFIGWLAEKYSIAVHADSFRTYSQNTIEDWNVAQARDAYREGRHAIHGVKTKAILDTIIL